MTAAVVGGLRTRYVATVIPAALLGVLFVILGLFVATQSGSYGRTWDEEIQDDYGRRTLAWYTSAGRNDSFLDYSEILQMPQHGPFFETVVAAAQSVTGEQWTTRAVVTGIGALVGIVAIALCGYELGGWWAALLSATGLALYPRYTGAIFNNSKDVPFTAAMIVVLWLTLRMVRRWDDRRAFLVDSTLVGVAIGAAASIRVNAVLWYAVLALLVVGRWLRHPRQDLQQVRQQALAAVLVGVLSLLTMCTLWPYIFLDPLPHFADSIGSMANFPWSGMVPFGDKRYSALDLPRRYTLEWLVIGSPTPVVVFAAIGGALTAARLRTGDARIILIGLSFVVPAAALILLRPTMYNGPRHFLFVVPSMVLLAVYALMRLWAVLARRHVALAGGLAALTLAAQAHTVCTAAAIHPYEYSYFNPIVGGLPGAVGRYELDYWGTCNKTAAEWLALNHGGREEPVTVDVSGPAFLTTNYLPRNGFKVTNKNPDFYIWSIREWIPDEYPSYRTVHQEYVQGYAMCVVKARSGPGK